MPDRKTSESIDRQDQHGSEDGVYLDDLADGAVIELETAHHHYRLVKSAHDEARITGHPKFCPEPVTVEIDGSVDDDFSVRPGYIGRGLHLVFEHPVYHTVTTSCILDVHRVA
ncbi:MAG TPA: hypothetical protein VGW33_13625 [Terriglobia bacterium]|nr:hypothetical protein [Terriglobia bacterium]